MTREGESMITPNQDQRHLAALIDGEPGPGGFDLAIDAVERDPELRARFERGLMIGQALRGERSRPMARVLSSRVSTALADEPVPLRPRARHRSRLSRLRWPVMGQSAAAGFALAASLAAVAVMVAPVFMSDAGPEADASAARVAASVTSRQADFARSKMVRADPPSSETSLGPTAELVDRWAMDETLITTGFDELLVDHRERASASALTGFIPYAAVVGPNGLR
jgi:negative regulator of sigma E activity